MRARSLGVILAVGCGVLLLVAGDFTPYVGVPDRDVYVVTPGPAGSVAMAAVVAALFGVVSGWLFARTGGLAFGPVRAFVIAAAGFTLVVYVYGPFKTVLGDGLVKYELPWGPERWGIAAGCGAVLAGAAIAAAVVLAPQTAASGEGQPNHPPKPTGAADIGF